MDEGRGNNNISTAVAGIGNPHCTRLLGPPRVAAYPRGCPQDCAWRDVHNVARIPHPRESESSPRHLFLIRPRNRYAPSYCTWNSCLFDIWSVSYIFASRIAVFCIIYLICLSFSTVDPTTSTRRTALSTLRRVSVMSREQKVRTKCLQPHPEMLTMGK